MKRTFLLLIIVIVAFNVNVFGQVKAFKEMPLIILNQMNKMGVDDNALLTELEANYFNSHFDYCRGEFDFKGKKIGFLTGSTGKGKWDKKRYFEGERNRYRMNYTPSSDELFIINSTQKEEVGGYDAIIICWSKIRFSYQMAIKNFKNSLK